MKNNKRKDIYEVCNEGCHFYSELVEGYYGLDGVIYNDKDEVVDEEEINIRDLAIDQRVEGLEIGGIIDFNGNKILSLDFFDKFTEWIESNGWTFVGKTSEVEIEE